MRQTALELQEQLQFDQQVISDMQERIERSEKRIESMQQDLLRCSESEYYEEDYGPLMEQKIREEQAYCNIFYRKINAVETRMHRAQEQHRAYAG